MQQQTQALCHPPTLLMLLLALLTVHLLVKFQGQEWQPHHSGWLHRHPLQPSLRHQQQQRHQQCRPSSQSQLRWSCLYQTRCSSSSQEAVRPCGS
ncbi:hypothetical protein COO60DRAFT_76145 [Scenedesmus sp. NREL 46B-D3]|nr:hypothetical protein COO60DRAFT_76145 [Scenedesmus sp. NREL 46B-D3]